MNRGTIYCVNNLANHSYVRIWLAWVTLLNNPRDYSSHEVPSLQIPFASKLWPLWRWSFYTPGRGGNNVVYCISNFDCLGCHCALTNRQKMVTLWWSKEWFCLLLGHHCSPRSPLTVPGTGTCYVCVKVTSIEQN